MDSQNDEYLNVCYEGFNEYRKGNYTQAIKFMDMAINIRKDEYSTYNCRGMAYRDIKQHDKAIQDFSTAIQIDGKDAIAYWNRGTT